MLTEPDFDFLTQVYSRSGLYEALKSPSLKQTQHLTVMLLDIDYFKSINDNYGHECGDKVLSVFARHIQKIVGDKGLVARMGGEEFMSSFMRKVWRGSWFNRGNTPFPGS